jgi:tartrate-resistant acid phosphatase type 5
MEALVPLYERSGVRVMFAGHEHNFQHSRTPRFDHFVTGAGGKVRRARPNRFAAAHTASWATDCHFVLGRIDGDRLTVRAIGAIDDPSGMPHDIDRFDRDGNPVSGPIEIDLD